MNKHAKRLQLGGSGFQRTTPNQSLDYKTDHGDQHNQTEFESSVGLNVKDHIDKLEAILMKIKDDLKISKDDMNNLREDFVKIKNKQFKDEEKMTKDVCQDVQRVQQDLKNQSQQTHVSYENFNQQVSFLYTERDIIYDGSVQANLHTNLVETHVGFRRVYD
ncbi:hypothetical protein pb186bvf_010496 [Paramecium bursaria]